MSTNAAYRIPPTGDDGPMMPKDLRKQEFARRLYQLMLKQNWRQSDLARAARLGRDSVSGYIRGRNLPDPKSAKALADAFGISIEELWQGNVERAIDSEMPSLEIKMAAGQTGRAWVRLNCMLPFSVAAKIAALIDEVNEAERGGRKT